MNIYSNNAYERYLKALQNNDENTLAALRLEFARNAIMEKHDREKMIDETTQKVLERIGIEIHDIELKELKRAFDELFDGRGVR